MTEIRKAVFPVGGMGTRFLPATKAMPKELLPIADKPLIQYAVEEAVDAGIDTLIFITGRHKRAIEDHFDKNLELEMHLQKSNKLEELDLVKNIVSTGVECIFVRQAEPLGLGHAILCAERVVGSDPFVVLLADDFIPKSTKNIVSKMIERYSETNCSQLTVMEINGPGITQYGVIEPIDGRKKITGIVEKPKLSEAPSNLASIGRYLLVPEIFTLLNKIDPKEKELQLTDAINLLAKQGKVEASIFEGDRFDCGSKEGFSEAVLHMLRKTS